MIEIQADDEEKIKRKVVKRTGVVVRFPENWVEKRGKKVRGG